MSNNKDGITDATLVATSEAAEDIGTPAPTQASADSDALAVIDGSAAVPGFYRPDVGLDGSIRTASSTFVAERLKIAYGTGEGVNLSIPVGQFFFSKDPTALTTGGTNPQFPQVPLIAVILGFEEFWKERIPYTGKDYNPRTFKTEQEAIRAGLITRTIGTKATGGVLATCSLAADMLLLIKQPENIPKHPAFAIEIDGAKWALARFSVEKELYKEVRNFLMRIPNCYAMDFNVPLDQARVNGHPLLFSTRTEIKSETGKTLVHLSINFKLTPDGRGRTKNSQEFMDMLAKLREALANPTMASPDDVAE